MATTMESRVAPAIARDGVDTRPLDGEKDLTTRVGARSHDRDEQTAAMTFLLPPGAKVAGSAMEAYWANYLRTAENQIKGDPLGHFIFTTFNEQQCRNEDDIERECRKLGAGEEMLNVYRMHYNRAVTEYLSEPTAFNLMYARKHLAAYKKELTDQQKAATRIQRALKSRIAAHIDTQSTESTAALMDLVNRAVNMTGNPEWEAFWAKFQDKPQLRIRKPKPKMPCWRGCGAESTTKVRGRNMCHPCADFAQNVGECLECGVWGPRLEKNVICADCYDAFLCDLAEQEDEARYRGYY